MTESGLIQQIITASKDAGLTVATINQSNPPPVAALVQDLVQAGFSVWWDQVAQKVVLK